MLRIHTLRVAFRKKPRRWWTRFIPERLRKKYSHAEIILPDGQNRVALEWGKRVGSLTRLDASAHDWDEVHLYVTEGQVERLLDFYNFTTGSRYDWLGELLSKLLPWRVKWRGRWTTYGWLLYALTHARILDFSVSQPFDRTDVDADGLWALTVMAANYNAQRLADQESIDDND